MLTELLHANDLAQISETIEKVRRKFIKGKEAIKIKCLKANLRKTKVMVSGRITKDGLSERKVDPCGVFRLTVKANSALYAQCGKWIYSRCGEVKRATPKIQSLQL